MIHDIPYYKNPTSTHCVQATLRMGFEYFNPEKIWTWEELDSLTSHREGITTWNMRGYIETSNLGYDVVIYDPIDYAQFVEDPEGYISRAFSPAYAEETLRLSDLPQAIEDAKLLLKQKNLNLHARSYTLEEYKNLLNNGYFIATWVSSMALNGNDDECAGHFILVFKYDVNGIYAHDPGGENPENMIPNRFIAWDIFERANKMNDQGDRGEIMAFKPRKKLNP